MIRIIEPYITWGYPDHKTVRDLIFKQGVGKLGTKTLKLYNNDIVEKALGKKNIICLEDLVNEVITIGPNFSDVHKFLQTFQVS